MKAMKYVSWPGLTLTAILSLTGSFARAQNLYKASNPPITPEEEAAIEKGRKAAKIRPVVPRKPLNSLEASRVRIFKDSKPSVVYISSTTQRYVLKNLQTGDISAFPPGTGTGFIWDDQGHVVTNHHVIEIDQAGVAIGEAEDLQVTLSNGKAYRARMIGKSLAYDIAVLRVFAPLKDIRPLPLGISKGLQVGQSVLAIGNPFGLDHTLTQGIISGLGREVVTDATRQRKIHGAIQTDAAINPGNSGGPLLDSGGCLIGMNTALKATPGAGLSFGFAIPVDTLNRVVPLLIAKGQLERPELGFTAVMPTVAALLGVHKGVVVGAVIPGGIADQAGLRGLKLKDGVEKPQGDVMLGDVIVGFQGRPVANEIQLLDLLDLEPVEALLNFEVLREGQRIRITMKPINQKPTKAGEEPSL